MDHQLTDELNLDTAMGVEFEHGEEEVVTQDITLESSDIEGMAMEFEHIEEQPMLMESGGEEIISSGSLIDEQFTLDTGDSYIVQDEKVLESNTNNQSAILSSDTMMDLQFEPQTLINTASVSNTRAQIIPVKAAQRALAVAPAPRQIAIAPKPAPSKAAAAAAVGVGKQIAIAPRLGPKPVAMTAVTHASGRTIAGIKTMVLGDVMQGQKPGQTLITQLGKQYVMMPAGAGGQKIKLVQAGGQPIQAQFVTTKNIATGQVTKKPMMAKVIVTSQPSSQAGAEQPAVITGIGVNSAPRFVQLQQKTIALSLANKVMGSPTKQGIRFSKPKHQQIVTVQSASPTKLIPASAKALSGTQKIVLTEGGNVVVKSALPHKTAQLIKSDGNVINVSGGQRTQIHQVNVPGKGVQYIRLVTNPSASSSTPKASEPPKKASQAQPKNIVFTDNKGNIIQMTAEKVVSGGQPPPLVVPGGASLSKVTAKPQQKLVRLAPVVNKASQLNTMLQQPARSGQSLLVPITAAPQQSPPSPAAPTTPSPAPAPTRTPSPTPTPAPEDSKAALRALIEDAVRDDPADFDDTNIDTHEVEVDFERLQSPVQEEDEDNDSSMNRQDSSIEEHPLIVIPSKFEREDSNSNQRMDDVYRMSFMNINPDITSYQQPSSPLLEEGFGERPRKACNCTKSQCLKLYCDCFANGEFCNRCNCTNCHNNLENEELRQKAIRGCLDRNPNAFRPKIGKAKAGGPEPVRRHNKGCNCKRSGCLKNYCECYEAKIACTGICKCVGCRNVEMALGRARRREPPREPPSAALYRPPAARTAKQPCSLMTTEVIEAVCQCLVAASTERPAGVAEWLPVEEVLHEFARCMQDIIRAGCHTSDDQGSM